MKKTVFSLFVLVMSLSVFAQKGEKAIGLNLGYGSQIKSPSIGVKFNYGITDQIGLSPSFNYYFKKDGTSEWEINVDAHYLFNVAPKVTVYPLAGLTFTSWRFDWGDLFDGLGDYIDNSSSTSSSVTRFGVNLGGGIGYELSNNISIGLELKYCIISDFGQFVPAVNLMYKF